MSRRRCHPLLCALALALALFSNPAAGAPLTKEWALRLSDPNQVTVEIREPIAIESDLLRWRDRLQAVPLRQPTIWCAPAKTLGRVLLCSSRHPGTLRTALLRASWYAEGSPDSAKGVLRASGNAVFRSAKIAGFDLRSRDVQEFLAAVDTECRAHGRKRLCLNRAERSFFELVGEQMGESGEAFAIVAFPTMLSEEQYLAAATHELLHAQFFLDANYADTVRGFWNELPPPSPDGGSSVRRSIEDKLGTHYDGVNRELLINEFQAYLLQYAPERGPLRELVGKHAEGLRRRLSEAGSPPFEFHHEDSDPRRDPGNGAEATSEIEPASP